MHLFYNFDKILYDYTLANNAHIIKFIDFKFMVYIHIGGEANGGTGWWGPSDDYMHVTLSSKQSVLINI